MQAVIDNSSITPAVRATVEGLERFAAAAGVRGVLRRMRAQAGWQLRSNPALAAAFVSIGGSAFGMALPAAVGSLRIVVTRGSGGDKIERHANATQYLLALEGPLETHVEIDGTWRIDHYGYGSKRLEDRWHVVPAGAWHRTVAPGLTHWGVAAFHSVADVSDEYRRAGARLTRSGPRGAARALRSGRR
jgi:hypothetical protein